MDESLRVEALRRYGILDTPPDGAFDQITAVAAALFEVPIAILALTALGLVTPKFLSKYRRHAIVVCLTAAAFITPGADPYSLFALAIPLYVLYELSVMVAQVAYRKKEKRAAKREAEELAESRNASAPA